jgi:cytochrome c-type biogenesis protein CcmE
MTAPVDDLTPRAARPPRKRRWLPLLLVALVIVAISALLFKTLGDATLFFKNADQAVADRVELEDRRFQVQGTVVDGSIERNEVDSRPVVTFSIAFNGVELDVVHVGNPPELFKEGEAVVLEGAWTQGTGPSGDFTNGANDGWYFASDRMLAKHDESYESENEERLRDAEEGGEVPIGRDGGGSSTGDGS